MKLLLKIKHYWISFGNFIGMINARIILTGIYFLILPLFSIPYKLFHFKKEKKQSNWKKYDRTPDIHEQF